MENLKVLPAQAGMIPKLNYFVRNKGGSTRASGDDPNIRLGLVTLILFYPRKRG